MVDSWYLVHERCYIGSRQGALPEQGCVIESKLSVASIPVLGPHPADQAGNRIQVNAHRLQTPALRLS
jgi:hypothetical protein